MRINQWILTVCLAVGMLAGTVRQAAADEWKEQQSRHFKVYYKSAPLSFVKDVETTAERLYEDIARDLGFTRYRGWSFEDQAKIYIYDDQEDFVNSARGANWSHGYASVREKTIRTFPAAYGFFDSLLPHEMGHIIFREFIGQYVRVPSWFEEGVAMYQEKGKRWGANKDVRKAIEEGKFIPLSELSIIHLGYNADRSLVDLFYSESASVVYYMITEFGGYTFVRLCRKLQEKKSFEQALIEAYPMFKSLNDLNDRWKEYVQEK